MAKAGRLLLMLLVCGSCDSFSTHEAMDEEFDTPFGCPLSGYALALPSAEAVLQELHGTWTDCFRSRFFGGIGIEFTEATEWYSIDGWGERSDRFFGTVEEVRIEGASFHIVLGFTNSAEPAEFVGTLYGGEIRVLRLVGESGNPGIYFTREDGSTR